MIQPDKYSLPPMEAARPVDVMTTGASHLEVLDFVAGCEVIRWTIQKERADIVFFPQRGAGPIQWTVEALMANDPVEAPLFVELPIGTHIPINTNEEHPKPGGLKPGEKNNVVAEVIDELEETGFYVPGRTKLMLVDEVQKGGTISQAAMSINAAMRQKGRDDMRQLSVVAVQDMRSSDTELRKTDKYKRLISNENKRFRATVVPLALFTVDRTDLLDEIWRLTTDRVTSQDDLESQPNLASRALFRKLVEVYQKPEQAMAEIDEMRRQELASDIGATLLEEMLADFLTDPRTTRDRPSDKHVFEWWANYVKATPEFQ
jgi:hypothetical protein